MEYLFKHSHTASNTGYFVCEPKDCADPEELARLFNARAFDSFLHDHLLKLLLTGDPKKKAALLAILDPDLAHAACLLAEAGLLEEGKFQNPPKAASCAQDGLPSVQADEEIASALQKNLLELVPVPAFVKKRIIQEFGHLSSLPEVFREINLQAVLSEIKEDGGSSRNDEIWLEAQERLARAGYLTFPEMRHEATLSPIALLREWPVSAKVGIGNPHRISGSAFSYGRGLSLKKARSSLYMEMIERISAWTDIEGGKAGATVLNRNREMRLTRFSPRELLEKEIQFFAPCNPEILKKWHDQPFYWLEADDRTLVPAQAVFLFCNLDEPAIFDGSGSNGLGAGANRAEARFQALLEILERDAAATTPFVPEACFIPTSRDPMLKGLLEDYAFKGIHPIVQDISQIPGISIFRVVVTGKDGKSAQGSAASLSGKSALLSALLETPWPYSWANPLQASPSVFRNLPMKFMEDLPDNNFASTQANLALLEKILAAAGLKPVYVDISARSFGFSVCRAFVPGLVMDVDSGTAPPVRLLKNCLNLWNLNPA